LETPSFLGISDKVPFDAVDTASAEVCKLLEGSRREVEIVNFAGSAAISDGDSNGLALVWEDGREGHQWELRNSLATQK